jgi:DHA1 family tetracycline resistance protein-like MFS transporter
MGFIMITVLIDMMSIGLIIPVLPVLVGTFTAQQGRAGLLVRGGDLRLRRRQLLRLAGPGRAVRPLRPPAGAADRLCGLALQLLRDGAGHALWMLIAVRLFSGAMQANIAVANAYVADITPPEDRAKRFGQLGAMFGIGFILGPVVGGLLGHIDLHLPFFVAGCIGAAELVLRLLRAAGIAAQGARREFRLEAGQSGQFAAAWRAEGRGRAGRGDRPERAGAVHPAHRPGCCTPVQVRLGAARTAGRCSPWASSRCIVQGVLLERLLKRFRRARLAATHRPGRRRRWPTCSGALATEGWMMYAVIACNLLGFTAAAAIQSMSRTPPTPVRRARPWAPMASLNSLMAVVAPVVGGPAGLVSHLPPGRLAHRLAVLTSARAAWR